MVDKNETEKGRYVPVLFPEPLLREIDDFRFENRYQSRAEAIRDLIVAGLRKPPVSEPAPKQRKRRRA